MTKQRFFGARNLAVLLMVLSLPVLASGGRLTGSISDAETGEALPGANIVIKNSVLGTTTSVDGQYAIDNIPAGSWQVEIHYLGYASMRETVEVSDNATITRDYALKTSAVLFDQVVVTGSRQPENLTQASNSMNIISRDDILPRGHHMLMNALQELPSVDLIGENVSIRGGSGYSFLSVGGSRVMMLIDDVPMLTSDFGRANFDFLPVTELERVEVLKGGGTVLYGSGGVSGVVNLISRQPSKKARISFRTTYGVFDDPSVDRWKWTDETLYYYGGDLSYSQSIGPVGLRLSASRFFSTGYKDNSRLSRYYFTARPTIKFPDGSNLNLFAAYNREDRELFFLWRSQNNALSTEYEDDAEVDGFLFSAIYNKAFSSRLLTKARFSVNSQLLGLPLSLTKGFDPALGISGELRGVWLAHRKHSLTFGLDYRHDIASSDFFGLHIANTYSPYLQDTWRLNDFLQLNAGLRYDSYILDGEQAESQLSPKLGISYQPHHNTVLHGSFGKGFRAASVAERYTAHDIQGAAELLPNPDLRPESATLFDLGIRQRVSDRMSIEVSGFFSEYDDLIELTQVSDLNLIMQFVNCDLSRIWGLEGQAKMRFWGDRLDLLMNGTWMHSESVNGDVICQLDVGESLPYRPAFSGSVIPSLNLGPVSIETEYRYLSRFDRVSFFLSEQRVPQKTVNFRARYSWNRFSALFQVKNAVNYNHTVVEQNVSEIRNFSLSLIGEI